MKKELEALNDLLWLSKSSDDGKKGISALKRADYNAYIIYRALTPPTADEVCKALSEYFPVDNGYHYDKEHKWFTRESGVVIWLLPNGQLNIHMDLPPHLITLIGRFYQSLEEENV